MTPEQMFAWLHHYGAMVSFGKSVTIWLAPHPFVTGASLEEAISRMEHQMLAVVPVVEGSMQVALLPERKEP